MLSTYIYNYIIYLLASLAMIGVFSLIYTKVTPYDELKMIREGQSASAFSFLGALIGFSLTLASSIMHNDSLVAFAGWAGAAMAVQLLVRLFWILVTTKRWQRDNRDPVIWGMVVITYGSACALAARLSLTPTQGFFLVFLMVNMAPLMNRFAAAIAIGVIVITSLAVTVLQQPLPPIPFAIYLLLAQSALWYMASSKSL